ncbi:hypothetical protein Dsin_017129 [Dipteronia sinensis]|uniref:Uncharacterized protein n=1 Tax=Dipteronia sinensis TaxID=43782 RepID=A0AAE0E7L3_9ROSI|nr:hypothetical protein Dsin_017129 [Dipteronia sinensis]
MKIFVWNASGLGSSRTFNTLHFHKQEVKPEVMFLMETRCGHDKMEKWRVSLGYRGKLVIDSGENQETYACFGIVVLILVWCHTLKRISMCAFSDKLHKSGDLRVSMEIRFTRKEFTLGCC